MLVCRSSSEINASAQQIFEVIKTFEIKGEWDANFMEGKIVHDIGENVQL